MKVGDLVYAKQDLKNGFRCIGLILDQRPVTGVGAGCLEHWEEFKILWNSESNPIGWWRTNQLQPAIEK